MATSEMSLLLAPLWSPRVENMEEFKYHYKKEISRIKRPDPEYALLGSLFCKRLGKYVGNVRLTCGDTLEISSGDIRDTMIALPDRAFGGFFEPRPFHIPTRKFLEKNAVDHDFVLLISDPVFSAAFYSESGNRKEAVREGVQLEFSYCIWDFRSERMVAYGIARSNSVNSVDYPYGRIGNRHPGAKGAWVWVMDKTAVQLLYGTPFEGPKAKGYYKFWGPGFW
jgi:hypothetical protein